MKNKLVCTLAAAFVVTTVAAGGFTGITAEAAEETAVISEVDPDSEEDPADSEEEPDETVETVPEEQEGDDSVESPDQPGKDADSDAGQDTSGDNSASDDDVTEKKEEVQEEEEVEEEEEEEEEEAAEEEEEAEEEAKEEETASETVSAPLPSIATVSKEELMAAKKQGIYAALRNAGMSHTGACAVMGVMDKVSGFEVSGDGLLGWTGEWKDKMDEYVAEHTSSYAYQTAFLLDTIENPETEGQFDALKAALMSDDSTISKDVRYFIKYYMDEADPDNNINISDCIKSAEGYLAQYDSVRDTYDSLTSIFDMQESVYGQMAADYACQFVGNPYVWGGTSLTNGADCSGFILSVYAHYGVSLPHDSASLRYVGYAVSASELLPGDIVCYDGHCAIYIGNGRIVHASNSAPYPAGGIKTSPSYNYRSVVAIRRIFDSSVPDVEPVILTVPGEKAGGSGSIPMVKQIRYNISKNISDK